MVRDRNAIGASTFAVAAAGLCGVSQAFVVPTRTVANTPSQVVRTTQVGVGSIAGQTVQGPSSGGPLGVSLFGAALAVAAASRRNRGARIVAQKAFENELGVQPPVGFWDPAGFTKDGDAKAFARRRETEIKHGRISMLATMGYITPELLGKFPGYLSPSKDLRYEDIPNGLGALSKVPSAGWFQIFLYCLYCEASAYGFSYDTVRETPGDFGWKPPLLATDDVEKRKKRLNAELANGRLAMMAIIGMFFQDGLTGSAWGDWALYTDSPLRAREQ